MISMKRSNVDIYEEGKEKKKCIRCHETKPLDEYYNTSVGSKRYKMAECKECYKERERNAKKSRKKKTEVVVENS